MSPTIDGVKVILTDPVQYRLLGCVFYGDPFHSAKEWSYDNEIGHLWNRFMRLGHEHEDYFASVNTQPGIGYEVHIEPSDYDGDTNKEYYVFVGLSVGDGIEIPLEMFLKVLPRTCYLEFSTPVTRYDVAESVFKELLGDGKNYSQSFPYIIQRYDERYLGLDNPDSMLDWLIPVEVSNHG